MSYVLVWLSEAHQTYNLAHGFIIDYINNNIGSKNKSSLAVIYISHRAHHRQFTVHRDACFTGGRVQNPHLPKKFINWHKHFSILSPQQISRILPASASCAANILLAHTGATYTRLPHVPAGFCALEKSSWKPRQEKPHKLAIKPQQLVLPSVKPGQVNCHVSETGK